MRMDEETGTGATEYKVTAALETAKWIKWEMGMQRKGEMLKRREKKSQKKKQNRS